MNKIVLLTSICIFFFINSSVTSCEREDSWTIKVTNFMNNLFQSLKKKIDGLKKQHSSMKQHRCIWKICSKPKSNQRYIYDSRSYKPLDYFQKLFSMKKEREIFEKKIFQNHFLRRFAFI